MQSYYDYPRRFTNVNMIINNQAMDIPFHGEYSFNIGVHLTLLENVWNGLDLQSLLSRYRPTPLHYGRWPIYSPEPFNNMHGINNSFQLRIPHNDAFYFQGSGKY